MYSNIFSEMMALLAASFGLLGLGLCHLTLARSAVWLRLSLGACVCVGSWSLAYAAVEHPSYSFLTLAVVGGTMLLSSVSFWGGSSRLFTAIHRFTQRTAVRGGAVCLGGLLVMGVALAKFEQDDTQLLEETDKFIELLNARPPMQQVEAGASTDQGDSLLLHTPIEPRSKELVVESEKQVLMSMNYNDNTIRSGQADDICNCHGWVFTGGRYWIEGSQVETILKTNGYFVVTNPKPGDLVVYRDTNTVTHTAIVRYTTPNQPPLVEGKWGWMGVFVHAVDQSCYGKNYTYYRSPREGHLLVGFGGKPAPTGSPSDPPVASETTD